jgi:hypothetical protein
VPEAGRLARAATLEVRGRWHRRELEARPPSAARSRSSSCGSLPVSRSVSVRSGPRAALRFTWVLFAQHWLLYWVTRRRIYRYGYFPELTAVLSSSPCFFKYTCSYSEINGRAIAEHQRMATSEASSSASGSGSPDQTERWIESPKPVGFGFLDNQFLDDLGSINAQFLAGAATSFAPRTATDCSRSESGLTFA